MTLRKSVSDAATVAGARAAEPDPAWIDVERVARVEVTSEAADAPIEGALLDGGGWRAGRPGKQQIRLVFDSPQRLTRIQLAFAEREAGRTQEFTLRWSPDHGRSFREIVRQQWNFSPSGATSETEDYQVDLEGVTVLELTIIPDVSGGPAHASLSRWRLA